MPTQPAASNSPERKGGLLHKGNTGCVDPQVILLSSLTLVEQGIKKSFLSRKRERRERSSFCKSVFSRKGLLLFSWIPLPSLPSLLEYQLPLLSPYYWTKALFVIPLLFAQAVSVVSNIMLIFQILFWKGWRVPSLGSFCAISCWTSILWDYFTQN